MAVEVSAKKFTDSLAAVCLAGHEWLKINQSMKLNTVPRIKLTLTTKISFFYDWLSVTDIGHVLCLLHREHCNFASKCNLNVNIAILENVKSSY